VLCEVFKAGAGLFFRNAGSGACLKTNKNTWSVMLNLFQHLMKSMSYETLK